MSITGLKRTGAAIQILALLGCGRDAQSDTPMSTPTPGADGISECASYYGRVISQPRIAPAGDIFESGFTTVRFEQIGSAEDALYAVVDDRKVSPGQALTLHSGRNVVDFLVIGEGEVHNWHAVFTVDGDVVFEHQQSTLEPAQVCTDEMYRYPLVFEVD